MTNNGNGNNAAKFGLGLIIGSAIGGALGMLLAPKSGRETREDITRRMKDMADRTKAGTAKFYYEVRDEVDKQLDTAKEKIDKNRYTRLVKDVIEDLKEDARVNDDTAKEVRERLEEDWDRIKRRFA